MVKFRRHTKSTDAGKHDSVKANFVSIPQKDAIAIVPPKKVIKALYDYTAPSEPPHYLSFSAGDFLHVVGRENDQDWYEACNPLHGSRGLVPVKYFETIGKTVRDSQTSTNSGSSAPHDSGYSEQPLPRSQVMSANGPIGAPQQQRPHHRMSSSVGKLGGGAMVYGVVSYDFHAERPDELEAKEGEAIIVIAQSNPEWFVAKPITRLGGPGLIPVSFIEIKDMHTGQTVTDTADAVARAGIPRVEEWKKMAADYKNTSIPLGEFGSSGHIPQGSTSGLQQGMGRMSMGGQTPNNEYGHSRTPSTYTYGQQQPPQQQQPQSQAYPLAPVRASVPRFLYADEKFHFIVECALVDGTHWDLSRIYEDFYELQINLIKAFPEEAGQTGQPRVLPYMPGPVQFVTDKISEGRRENLDEYLHNLLKVGPHITNCALVRGFFSPREGDYEVDPNEVDLNEHSRSPATLSQDRYSQTSQNSQQNLYQSSQSVRNSQPLHQRQMSSGNAFAHQKSQSSLGGNQSNGRGHYRTPSDFGNGNHTNQGSMPPPMLRQATQASATSNSPASSVGPGASLKVKVWFDRETCVVVRMPPRGQFRFPDLYRKIVERRRLEFSKGKPGMDGEEVEPELEIEYRDERDGEYYALADDEELEQAVGNSEKLTLVVRALGET